jgi:hypothetical protein
VEVSDGKDEVVKNGREVEVGGWAGKRERLGFGA